MPNRLVNSIIRGNELRFFCRSEPSADVVDNEPANDGANYLNSELNEDVQHNITSLLTREVTALEVAAVFGL